VAEVSKPDHSSVLLRDKRREWIFLRDEKRKGIFIDSEWPVRTSTEIDTMLRGAIACSDANIKSVAGEMACWLMVMFRSAC
jgi:hypothetical protein